MKKQTSMYKRYMFHPILYKTVTRTSIVAVLMLLWQRYVSDGTFTIWEAPGFLCGVVLLIWAWVEWIFFCRLPIPLNSSSRWWMVTPSSRR